MGQSSMQPIIDRNVIMQHMTVLCVLVLTGCTIEKSENTVSGTHTQKRPFSPLHGDTSLNDYVAVFPPCAHGCTWDNRHIHTLR